MKPVSLKTYLYNCSPRCKQKFADFVGKKLNYVYQVICGYGGPSTKLEIEAIVEFSKKNPAGEDGTMILSKDSILEGYKTERKKRIRNKG